MEKPKLIEDLGTLFTNPDSKRKYHYGIFECPYCHKEFKALIYDVEIGNTNSCGCYQKQRAKESHLKHGLYHHPLYKIWRSMITRCYYKTGGEYMYYGGRGIIVCDYWLNDFLAFYDWCIKNGYKNGLELDRKNNDGNYEPDNCKFSTRSENSQNTKLIHKNNTTGYRCVFKRGSSSKYFVIINNNGIKHWKGGFDTAENAARYYNKYVIENKTNHPLNPINEGL